MISDKQGIGYVGSGGAGTEVHTSYPEGKNDHDCTLIGWQRCAEAFQLVCTSQHGTIVAQAKRLEALEKVLVTSVQIERMTDGDYYNSLPYPMIACSNAWQRLRDAIAATKDAP